MSGWINRVPLVRDKFGLELHQYFLDCLSRGFIDFDLQHAPIALHVKADDLDLVQYINPEMARLVGRNSRPPKQHNLRLATTGLSAT